MAANRALATEMRNPESAKFYSGLGIKSVDGDDTPIGFIWHHEANRPGVMQLVPDSQHYSGSPFSDVLHPNGMGGMANWGYRW